MSLIQYKVIEIGTVNNNNELENYCSFSGNVLLIFRGVKGKVYKIDHSEYRHGLYDGLGLYPGGGIDYAFHLSKWERVIRVEGIKEDEIMDYINFNPNIIHVEQSDLNYMSSGSGVYTEQIRIEAVLEDDKYAVKKTNTCSPSYLLGKIETYNIDNCDNIINKLINMIGGSL